MATQIILLVHGMGTHPPGEITQTFTKAVNDRASCFGLDFELSQADCKLEEYNYSDLLDEVRQQFADNAAARQQGFGYLTGQGFAAELIAELTALENKFGKDEFLYTHWLDVVLYGTTYYGEKIRNEFAQKYHALGMSHEHKNLHVVCHSLGTAVVHDTLAKLYRPGHSFDTIPDYPPGNFNMQTLWTFANVSRLLHLLNGLADPNHSTVVPGGNGCTNFFFNIRHKFDPFTWFLTYKRAANYLTHLTIDEIRKFNTHDFYEYVTAPEVSRHLLANLCGRFVEPDDFEVCVSRYCQGAITGAKVDDLKNALDAALHDPSPDNLLKTMKAYKVVVAAAKAAGEDI